MIDGILDFFYHFIGFGERCQSCGNACGSIYNACNCHEGHGDI